MSGPVLDLRLERIELAALEAESIGWLPLGMGVTCTLETRRRWCVESLAGSL